MVSFTDARKVGLESKIREEVVGLIGESDGKVADISWEALEKDLLGLSILRAVALLKLKGKLTGDPKQFFKRMTKLQEKAETQILSRRIDADKIQAEKSGSGVLPLDL